MTTRHLRPVYNRLRANNYTSDTSNTILLFSVPRSGSTWLAGLLQEISDSAIVDEPLWQGPYRSDLQNTETVYSKLSEVKNLGFHFFHALNEAHKNPKEVKFFKDLLDLKIIHPDIFSETTWEKLSTANRFIFKFNYAGLMAPWLIKNFNFLSIALLRHPCAVVASQLKHPAFSQVLRCKQFVLPSKSQNTLYNKYSNQLARAKTPEAIMASVWALNFVSIRSTTPSIITTYEKLVIEPFEELGRIFDQLKVQAPQLSDKQIRKGSSSASATDMPHGNIQLNKWRKELTVSEVNNILNVLEDFEIDFYDSNLEPHYHKLSQS